jgi:steroid 5-alpha reductase family enzyme
MQVIADEQKRAFRAEPANRGRFITTGLWRYSRHPNYFGQMLMSVALALFMLPAMGASATSSWWAKCAVLAPAFEILLLLRVSGIPLLEQAGRDKWSDDAR